MSKEVIEKDLKQYLAIKRLGYIKNIRDDNIGVNSSFMSYIKKDIYRAVLPYAEVYVFDLLSL